MAKRSASRIYIGVDVGATKVGINAIDSSKKPVSANWTQLSARSDEGPRATIAQIVAGVEQFLGANGLTFASVAALGLDSPGPADNDGVIQPTANMKHPQWRLFPLRRSLEERLAKVVGHKIPVSYENDGNAAAYWESYIACPQGTEVMAMLAPGTGLGGGIVISGQLLRGSRGMSAELGHVEIVHRPFVEGAPHQPCGCGQHYCAESYVSVAALTKALPAALELPQYKDHPLWKIEGENVWRKRALEVRALAAKGDELALALFDWQAEALGKLCRQVSDTIDPDRIVIGGGFIEGGKKLTDRIMKITRETFKKMAFPIHARQVKIEKAAADDQAGCLGAALSAYSRSLKQS